MTAPTPTKGAVAMTGPVILGVVAVRGAVLAKLWAWFVVPLGAPHVAWLDAMGLCLVATVVLRTADRGTTDPDAPRLDGYRVFAQGATTCGLLMLALALAAVVAAAR